MEKYLEELNESQRKAVVYLDGPALVIAGAGSGKTRVLTYKIAWLLKQGFAPHRILALTFTNKAAREMKERIAGIVGEETARRLWMGTFHSIFSRILRREAERLGFTSNFTIYDATDSKNLIKSIIKEMQLDDKVYRPGMIQSRISNAKNALITYKAYEQNKQLIEDDLRNKIPLVRDIYARYQNRCLQAGAMDFDDLLLQTNLLFRDHPDVLEKYRDYFQYVLVDEYQDTNFAQHLIVKRLCEGRGNLCVVGDDAQSIYSFRGANIDNILQFKQLYPGCQIFKLERNYRSTQNIVNAANSLIRKNTAQIPKQVYSEKEEGSKLQVLSSYSDYEEAYAVAARVQEMRRQMPYADMAVLYRTNAQSRILEEAMRKRNIPYRVYGGLSFYQRKEVKDVISYFRLVINPHDEEAFKRVINYPTRGIGDTTVSKLVSAATTYGVSLWAVLQSLSDYAVPVNAGTAKKLVAFRELIDSFRERNQELPADEIATAIVKESGIVALLAQDHSTEGIGKFENLQELLKGIAEFCQIRQEEGNTQVSLGDFLAEVSLLTDQDQEGDENTDKVTLMTVHAAKGLEFGAVFVVGLEEELFPSAMSKDNPRAIEEERRLFYVAITRAEHHCILSFARSRFKNGQTTMCIPSRFLRDIDMKYLETEDSYRRPETDSFVSERKTESRPAFTSPLQQAKMRETPSVGPRKLTRMTETRVSSAAEQDFSDFQVGMRVRHARFGEGVILSFDGDGNNRKALIEFDNSGQKQLFLKFARLEKM
ncbi:UvrD-helicase domain-containing protein [Parabacteroides sp. AD58]|uniref:DNA 3'-5' helicase n=1 Tax=Parabacteroides absconsus TaxID=2951805 RepID=A0ABZ2IPN2_9BACT|nr:UvrD-helicase domain-containing protein [Parabacteroides sp. AD58]MCM6900977.1 UvrD-helicase domain-containing protein [Parabacteroides sp. AD58]